MSTLRVRGCIVITSNVIVLAVSVPTPQSLNTRYVLCYIAYRICSQVEKKTNYCSLIRRNEALKALQKDFVFLMRDFVN